jgi:hypothetical protein
VLAPLDPPAPLDGARPAILYDAYVSGHENASDGVMANNHDAYGWM